MSELQEHQFCECDEMVREYRGQLSNEMRPYYLKSEADKVITEKDKEIEDLLRQNLELCQAVQVMYSKEEYGKLQKEIESLKASHYAEMVDAGMCEHKLKRALWLARAEWARSSALSYHLIESHPDKDMAATYKRKANKWEKVKYKCLKKAEAYK